MKAENSNACVKVNWNVCRIAIVLLLPVVPSAVYMVLTNPIIQSKITQIIHSIEIAC
jgi:hypothetical protein